MGKKQHQQDKLYLTTTEWSNFYGGKKSDTTGAAKAGFRRLPFDCCSISLQPFENPFCTKEGVIFDLTNVVPFVRRFGVNPVTGEKMLVKDLIKLCFHKNAEGKYHCPVTFKVFNENTHIVAIRPTGNVFAYDAVERLNIKAKHYKDLITDEPFSRGDVITIQDPTNLDKFNLSSFYHLKKNLKLDDEDEELSKKDPKHNLKTVNAETRDILNELDSTYKAPEKVEAPKKAADRVNAAHYSTGAVAASFTSTAMVPTTQHEPGILDETLLKYERVKKKGYVRINTNMGPLNLELHCDIVPKTCENFMLLCSRGYYSGVTFHRSIRNFMIQGGDPTGTGKGGSSAWEGPFKDEFKFHLVHAGRGVLSMANSGPDTNTSQFFITYRSARHLDNKHTVFGKLVGGIETLDKMEAVEVDKDDKPLTLITIENVNVFVDPFKEAEEQLQREREKAIEADEAKKAAELSRAGRSTPSTSAALSGTPKVFKEGVGKYINTTAVKRSSETEDAVSAQPTKKAKAPSTFGNFSNW